MKAFIPGKKLIASAATIAIAAALALTGCNNAANNNTSSENNAGSAAQTAAPATYSSLEEIFEKNTFTKITDNAESDLSQISISKEESIKEICELMTKLDLTEATEQEAKGAGIDGGTELIFTSESTTVTVQLFSDFARVQANDGEWMNYKVGNAETKDAIFDIIDQYR